MSKSKLTRLTRLVFLPSAEHSFSAYCFSFFALASAKKKNMKFGSTSLPQARKQIRAMTA
jgi:hypothetical protein